jgi:hypothetical protein
VLPDIIERALKDKEVYIFGELLKIKGIDTCSKTHFETLKLFAHGSWSDYQAKKSNFITLTPEMQKKLQMLTLVDLCSKSSVLSYL